MVRGLEICRRTSPRFPHTRGDGPFFHWLAHSVPMFSPHTWGWSGCVIRLRLRLRVFPTHVGTVRLLAAYFSYSGNACKPVRKIRPVYRNTQKEKREKRMPRTGRKSLTHGPVSGRLQRPPHWTAYCRGTSSPFSETAGSRRNPSFLSGRMNAVKTELSPPWQN